MENTTLSAPTTQEGVEQLRHFTAVLEDLRSEFRVFGEAQNDLIARVSILESRMDSMSEDILFIKVDIKEMKEEIKEMKVELKEIKEQLKSKVSADDFDKIQARVAYLEKVVPAQ